MSLKVRPRSVSCPSVSCPSLSVRVLSVPVPCHIRRIWVPHVFHSNRIVLALVLVHSRVIVVSVQVVSILLAVAKCSSIVIAPLGQPRYFRVAVCARHTRTLRALDTQEHYTIHFRGSHHIGSQAFTFVSACKCYIRIEVVFGILAKTT